MKFFDRVPKTVDCTYKFNIINRANGRTRINVEVECKEYNLNKTKMLEVCQTNNKKELYECLKRVDEMDMKEVYDMALDMINKYFKYEDIDEKIEILIEKIENKKELFKVLVDK